MRNLLLLLLPLVLTGCGQSVADTTPVAGPKTHSIQVTDERRCHQCGMFITRYPGPKGVARVKGQPGDTAFCSTSDLFQFILQPQNRRQVEQAWVHDLAQTDWDKPSDSAFIPANRAWYVVGSSRHGAMGPTLASFSSRNMAEAFANSYGGKVRAYDQLTLEMLGKGGHHKHKHH
ncbi:nitrous oxide reductase accessory protein NosL [Ferrimonas futtsuensis]|uniref:nitrous oxide reductase accessory protein NosL n=1 Tax=Ferrimonas futtsuensis TaxID=364764 RepID=UPI000481FB4A|nr:nitrous oxide reductase accessory protein NosL [Ferrimonas futtsuensis]